ncbi:MAG TPA: GAF and ANTAR domain-containing protein [Acidimicrobiales bacterium]|nr:GAF and ANTAR domain-containing protein [Acidimicrobiales bacterium]
MAADEPSSALEVTVAALADALFAEPFTPAATLGRIVALATDTVFECDASGILVDGPNGLATAAASAPIVAALHALQVESGEGPCFDAVASQTPFYATDLARDPQWPTFARGAVALGIRSVLAYPVVNSGRASALNLYAAMPEAFGAADRARGLLLSVFAGLAIGAADELERADAREANLRAALRTRELIGQAQGILMERERITSDQAFALLRDSSQYLNVKLREVAQNLVETGETPTIGPG